jgi:hypothetical protein
LTKKGPGVEEPDFAEEEPVSNGLKDSRRVGVDVSAQSASYVDLKMYNAVARLFRPTADLDHYSDLINQGSIL